MPTRKPYSASDRKTRFPLIRSLLFVTVLFFLYKGGSSLGLWHKPGDTPASENAVKPDGGTLEQCGQLLTYIVKPGDTFHGILAGFGVPYADAISFYRSLYSLGLPSLLPGDSMIVTLRPDKSLHAFSLLTRLQCWYHLQRDDMSLIVEKQPLETQRERCVVKGVLVTSLSEDMQKLGVSDALVARLADIFAWDINFFVDPRKGDRFEVVFEKLYRGGRFVDYGDILAAVYENNGVVHSAIGFRDENDRLQYYNQDGRSLQKQFLKAPLRFRRISSSYTLKRRHPVLGIVRPHQGIDYAAPTGTPVFAAADGTVRFSGVKGGYGNYIQISHGGGYETCYGHLHRINKGIRYGTRVGQGEQIGTVGSTGLSTGPHLDYRMLKGGRYTNPLTLTLPSRKSVAHADIPRFDTVKNTMLALFSDMKSSEGLVVVDMKTVPAADTGLRHITIMGNTPVESHDNAKSN